MFGGLLLASAIFNLVHGAEYAWCEDLSYHGELRPVLTPNSCFTEASKKNYFATEWCYGYGIQQFMYCLDGTIRNYRWGNCLNAADGWLKFWPCSGANSQLWDVFDEGDWDDPYGISQTVLSFRTRSNGLCLWGPVHDGKRYYMQTHTCESVNEVLFFFRNRGKVIHSGFIKSQWNNLCLVPDTRDDTSDKIVDVFAGSCVEYAGESSLFDMYETGEIRNTESSCCLNPYGTLYDHNIYDDVCDYTEKRLWETLEGNDDGDFVHLKNRESGECMEIRGEKGINLFKVHTKPCFDTPKQRFAFVSDDLTSTHDEL